MVHPIQSGQTKAFLSRKERKGRKEENKKIEVGRVLIGDKKKNSLRSLRPLRLKNIMGGLFLISRGDAETRRILENEEARILNLPQNKTPRLRISA